MNPLPNFRLDGRKVLVTGASSGLGRHFARTLAAAGAEIYAGARRADRLADLVSEIEAGGGRAHAVSLDVTQRDSVRACFEQIGPVQVLVNNAGVGDGKRPLDHVDDDYQQIVDTNLRGAWMVAQEAARGMAAAKTGGSIINITSILASRVSHLLGLYAASKAGLAHLTRSMALEMARYQVRVNSIAPGYFSTEINADFLTTPKGEEMRQRVPMRRYGTHGELDGALLLLASDAGSYITGAEIVVDGGHLCSAL
jgi:NAD(P)-dependent dehydrogenase (short-subunit alcohol dehydrogenase family)